jgi:undecaprenyl-diphosphatase
MHDIADLIARHAVVTLLIATTALLFAMVATWQLMTRYMPRAWPFIVDAWNAFRRSSVAARLRRVHLIGPSLTGALTAARYLGIYAVLAFIVAASAGVAFLALADEIGVDEDLGEFDVVLSDAFRTHLTPGTLQAFAWITRLGDSGVLIVIGAVVAAVLLVLRERLLALAWLVATVSGGALVRVLKSAFERARPLHDHGLTVETSWSFPSGHAAGSMLVYGLLTYFLVRRVPAAWRLPIALVMAAVIIFVGSSRVLLQVHYLSDVLAGYAVAAAWAALCIAGLEAVRWQMRQSR